MKKATFGAGCFWGVEATFRRVPGVTNAAVGYEGGHLENPTYRDVCTDRTGHAEVVQVEYDPQQVSYERLLEVFWECHNPTQLNRQGPDIGTQYRSVIFYHDEGQKAEAEESKKWLEASGRYPRPVVTQIVPAGPFYRAEEYHQRYNQKRGLGDSCSTEFDLPSFR
jgi:peptide-methionine (S)-S-oxide reductase